MNSARLPFDADGPFVVATEEIATRAGKLRRGQAFPPDGFSPFDLLTLWGAFKIDNASPPVTADLDIDRMTPAQLAELDAATAPVSTVTMGGGARASTSTPRRSPRR